MPPAVLAKGDVDDVVITWQTANTDIVEFDVYRSEDGSVYTLLNTVSGTVLTYTDTTADKGTVYSYTVVARNSRGLDSVPSDPASVRTGGGSDDKGSFGCIPAGGSLSMLLLLILTLGIFKRRAD